MTQAVGKIFFCNKPHCDLQTTVLISLKGTFSQDKKIHFTTIRRVNAMPKSAKRPTFFKNHPIPLLFDDSSKISANAVEYTHCFREGLGIVGSFLNFSNFQCSSYISDAGGIDSKYYQFT